jgi:RHS repeat-associated protein
VEGRASDGTLLRKRTATYYEGTGALKTVTNVVVGGVNPETGQPYQDDPATNGMSSFTYDAFGNLESATDPRGFLLTYAYDDLTQSYRTSISDSFGYTSTSTPNHLFGTVANVVDVNGHELDYFFDDFGRLTEVFGPTDTDEPSVAFDYGLQPDDPAPPFPAWARTRHRDVQHPEDPIVAVTFSDGIDRVIQTKKDLEKDDGSGGPPVVGMSVSGAVTFDARGRIRLQGQPVFETVSPESHLDGSTATTLSDVALKHPTEMEYDVLSRPVRVATPDDASPDPSVTLTEYGFGAVNGVATLTTTVTDPLGNVRITHRDVDESVVGMVEFNRLRNEQASTELVTSYEYNPLDELVAVEDALGNRTTAVYDTVGRMVTLVSPDSGRTEWRYDRSGNLGAKQTAALRAQNQLVRYEYDFNRLRRVDYPASVDVVYAYGAPEDAGDASFNRAGRVVEETSEAGSKVYEYDRLGQVTRLASTFQRIRTPNQDPYRYTMGYEYDSFGRLLTLEFPGESREIVRYGYDRGGLVKSARGEITGTPPQHAREVLFTDYFKHVGYDEFEQRVRFVAGNDNTTRYGYYEKTHRLETVQADHRDPRLVQRGLPARPFQRLHYEYDRVGNPLEVRNDAPFDDSMQPGVLVATTEQVFTYDDLYQLRTADGLYQDRSAWRHRYGLSFEYDEIGRILFKDQASFRDLPNPPDEWTPDHPDQVQTYRAAYTYAAPRPNAPTRIDETILNGQVRPRRLSYDGSGNQTGWIYHQNRRRTVEWTDDDRVREISEQGLRLTRALYDGDGNRAVHVGYHGQEETAYLGENLTVRNAVYPSKHVFAGKDLAASKLDPEWFPHPPTLYYHPDQLGSAQFASNDQQELTQHDEFFPTGEVWQTQTEGRYSNRRVTLFTGKELDPGANLYYFGSRWYDPRQSQWISPDPLLAHYMQGRVFGGVYSPRQLGLYGYAWNNPARLRDQDGNFVNFLIGAAVGAGLDLAVQVALVAAGKQEKIDGWSILVSAGAGAAGVGIASAITKAKHLSTLGKVAAGVGGDTAVSVGSKAAKGEEITALGVAADVALGQAGGKVLGKAAKGKAEKGTQSKLLEQAAKRAERLAKPGRSHGSKRPGRQAARAKKAADARAEATGFLDNAEVRGGAVGSNAGSKIVDVATQDKNKKEEKRAGRRLTPEQKAAVVEFNRLYGPDTAPPQ